MKLYDFDAKFYDYVRVQMAMMPKLTEDEIESRYNEMMANWLNAPAQWLDGAKPGEYFRRYDDPKDLLKLLEGYLTRDIGLPEPLYSRIVEIGAPCVPGLIRLVRRETGGESLRATAIALLKEIGAPEAEDLYIDLVAESDAMNELGEMACEALKALNTKGLVDRLLARYDQAPDYARMMMLDICAHAPEGVKAYELLVDRLRRDADNRGFCASLLADLGDERAIEPLLAAAELSDIDYLNYIEIREAIERLGGDAGEMREFNGDQTYEALRNL